MGNSWLKWKMGSNIDMKNNTAEMRFTMGKIRVEENCNGIKGLKVIEPSMQNSVIR